MAARRHTYRSARCPLFVETLEDRTTPNAFMVRNTNPTGPDSLSQRLMELSMSGDMTNTISFLPNLSGAITLTSKLPPITKSVDIQGPGAAIVIDGGGNAIFTINDEQAGAIAVTISDLTLRNGSRSTDGGAVFNKNETVTLRRVTFLNNHADGDGGAVATNDGVLAIEDCFFDMNDATTSAGALSIDAGSVTIDRTRFQGNSGSFGVGAIRQTAGTLIVRGSAIDRNPGQFGGGCEFGGTVLMEQSSVTNNDSGGGGGGGITVVGAMASVTLRNTTVSGNLAADDGGGVQVFDGTVNIQNSTIAFNKAATDGSGNGGGLSISTGATVTLTSTIVAENMDLEMGANNPDVFGAVVAGSANNLIGSRNGLAGISSGMNNNQIGAAVPINPRLLPLESSGLTRIHPIQATSPALNTGLAPTTGKAGDGRGGPFVRASGVADIGAFEVQSDVTLTVTTADDENDSDYNAADLSLREALRFAGIGAPTVTFAPALSGATVTLTQGPLILSGVTTVAGPGADKLTIDAGGRDTAWIVTDFDLATTLPVTISGVTVRNGASGAGSLLSFGGGIVNVESLTLDGVSIEGNRSTESGGGILSLFGTLTVKNSTVSGNSADESGGGIAVGVGNAVVSNSTISGNTAKTDGGGIFFFSAGSLTVRNSTIAINQADGNGGGGGKGGGVSINNMATATLESTIVADNTVGSTGANPDVNGTATASFSLIGNPTGFMPGTGSDAGSILNGEAELADMLAANGGPTRTLALAANSRAVNKGSNPDMLTLDQRGQPRNDGMGIDIGAVEFNPNTAPTVTMITNQSTTTGTATSAITFTVADAETAAGSLTVTTSSSNTTLLPATGIAVGGTGGAKTLTLTPAAGQNGTATVTVTVADAGGMMATTTFTLTVAATANTVPTVTMIADQTTATGTATGAIAFTVADAETAAGSLTVTTSSSNTTLLPAAGIVVGGTGGSKTLTLTPAAGQTGTATVTVTVADAGGLTASRTFTLTVGTATTNTAPTVTAVGNQTTAVGTAVGPIGFTVADTETAAGSLTVTAVSSNATLLPAAGVVLGGSGGARTLTLTPAAGQTGTATVMVTVTDAGGLTVTTAFTLTVATTPTARPALVGFPQTAAGGASAVLFANSDGGTRFSVTPFSGFNGGVRTAAADFNNDGVADLVAGTGPGRATRVVVIDGATQKELFAVDAFEASFTGGVYVAAGDLDGDGRADLVITPDEGGGPRVDVYSGNGFGKSASFFGIDDPNFRGGARASTGDINGDGRTDLIVVAGFGGGPRVAGFDGKSIGGAPSRIFGDFFAFEQTLRNGVFVAAGDLDGDGFAELIAGGGPGGGPRVTAFSGKDLLANTQSVRANFFGGDDSNRGGIRVAVKNLDGDNRADLVVGGPGRATAYLGKNISAGGTPPTAFELNPGEVSAAGVFVG